jgi:hypothetical protein
LYSSDPSESFAKRKRKFDSRLLSLTFTTTHITTSQKSDLTGIVFAMASDLKFSSSHVEEPAVEEQDLKLQVTKSRVATTGTVQLTAGKTVYIPDPTADPRGEQPPCTPLRTKSNDENQH